MNLDDVLSSIVKKHLIDLDLPNRSSDHHLIDGNLPIRKNFNTTIRIPEIIK